jgi:hypothetical protein
MTIEQAFVALKHGKPIRRMGWDRYRLLRFCELWDGFSGADIERINATCLISGEDLLAHDWIIGKFHPVKNEVIWEVAE